MKISKLKNQQVFRNLFSMILVGKNVPSYFPPQKFSLRDRRNMPVILPHLLVPFLIQNNIMLNNDDMDREIEKYWQFLSSTGFPHTMDKAGTGCIPLWIWGDDAQYNERQSKVVIVAIGCVLDTRTCSKTTVWPLFAYKVDSWTFYSLKRILCMSTCLSGCAIPKLQPK